MAEADPVNIRRKEFETLREEVLRVKNSLDGDNNFMRGEDYSVQKLRLDCIDRVAFLGGTSVWSVADLIDAAKTLENYICAQ